MAEVMAKSKEYKVNLYIFSWYPNIYDDTSFSDNNKKRPWITPEWKWTKNLTLYEISCSKTLATLLQVTQSMI